MVLDMNSLSGLFTTEQKADLDTAMKDLEEYLEMARNAKFPCLLTKAAGIHTPGHVECAACAKERDMLIAIVRGQGMTKMLCEARQKGNSISLKCDRCDYETKHCRQSRAKKHMTSHQFKHHGDVEYVSCEASHVGRDGREASSDEEQSSHGDKKVDKVGVRKGAAVGGAQDGVPPQFVQGEVHVDDQPSGGASQCNHDTAPPQVVLLVRDSGGKEHGGSPVDGGQDGVLPLFVPHGGDGGGEVGRVDDQHGGEASGGRALGDDAQGAGLPQVVLGAGDSGGEVLRVDDQLGAWDSEDDKGAVPRHVVLLADDIPQVVFGEGDSGGEEVRVDYQLPQVVLGV